MGAKGLAHGRSHAIRPWPDQEANEGKDGAANETLAISFWQIRGTDVIKISGVVVEPRWRYHTSRLSPKVRLEWLAPPALRLALRYICMKIHSLCQEHSLPTRRHPSSGRAARSRRKSQLGYFLFGSVARLPGNSVWTQTAWNGTNDHE